MGILNRIQFMMTLIKGRLFNKRIPLVVVLNTTFRCNLNCGYCYAQYSSRKEEFTTEELLGLIDDLASLGTCSITLGGGEPLIRDDIGIIIERIKKKNIECGMNTNGVLIPQRIKELRNIDMVCVSIDGPEQMNDLNRGEGSFKKIMKGIDKALEAGLRVHTTTVITRYNYESVDWIVDMARRKGIQAEFNFLFHQTGEKKSSDEFMASNQAILKAAKRIADLKAQGAPILFSEKVYRLLERWPDYQKRVILNTEPQFEYIPCYAGRFMMFINADGKVYPCVQLIDEFKALDFREAGILKAWRNCFPHNCRACYFPCFNEFNSIMGLDWRVIFSQVISTLKRE